MWSIAKPEVTTKKSSSFSLTYFHSSIYELLKSSHFCAIVIAKGWRETDSDFMTVHAGKSYLVVKVSCLRFTCMGKRRISIALSSFGSHENFEKLFNVIKFKVFN